MGSIIITALIVAIVAKFSDGLLTSGEPNSICERVFSINISQTVPYYETYKKKVFDIFYQTKTRINYRTEYKTVWHREEKCCSGYYEINSECKPLCQNGCENGYCYKPNECRCNYYYIKDSYNSSRCVPACENECIQGTCSKPNSCTCNPGYSLSYDGFTCTPDCNSCPKDSVCTAPDVCECISNYKMEAKDSNSKEMICTPICERTCVNSDCIAPDICKCREGYEDLNEDAFTCTPKCSSLCEFGTCTAPEVCTCNQGYSRFLNSSTCQPVCNRSCINGACIAPNVCSCSEGYAFMDDSESICEPICENSCENGSCTAPQICTCNDGYQMNDKSRCEPVCTEPCHNGECTSPDYCTCLNGYGKTDNFTNLCEPICNTTCENGRCTAPEVCTCNEGYHMNNESTCEPVCTHECYNGKCTAPEYCTCFNGYNKTDNFTNLCKPVCNGKCENGICSAPDECTCNEGFEKYIDECVPECKCIHGSCTGKNRTCVCEDGYELWGGENSLICVPICDQGCVNADCISPQECKCHDNYIMNNSTDNNNTCISVCGVECIHGLCLPEEKTCSCFYGWIGRSCEVALKCAAVFDKDTFKGGILNSLSYENETESIQKIEFPWEGPICEEYCFPININQAECFNKSIQNDNSTKVLCFLNMDLDCNFVSSQVRKTQSDSIIWSGIMTTMYAVITGTIVVIVFLLVRRYKRNRKPIAVVCRSESFQCAADFLIEEEGISL